MGLVDVPAAVEAPQALVESPQGSALKPPQSPPKAATAASNAPWVASTYFAEGLPFFIVHHLSSELFTALGASLQAIGLTALLGLPWNAKSAWSPLVDMYGTARRWIIAAEIALALAVAAIAWPAGRRDLDAAAAVLLVVAFLAATHDIAVDGFYLRALPKDQQASFTGLRIGAYRASLLSLSGFVVLAGLRSWSECFLAAGGVMLALALLHAALLPREERRPEATRLRYIEAFRTFLTQPRALVSIAFILTFRAGDALMFAMQTPLLKDLGLDTAARGVLRLPTTIASVAGSMIGGALIGKLGLKRTLAPIAVLQSAAILLYAWLAWARPSIVGIGAAVLVEQLIAGVGTSGLMVFLMRRVVGEYKASHFAMASSLMSLGMTFLGSGSGFVAAEVGFVRFFVLAFAASLPGVLLAFLVPKE